MSVRSVIMLWQPSGTHRGIYCHNDGYLEHNGVILQENYNSFEKALELIRLGDISTLGKTIGEKHDFRGSVPEDEKGFEEWCTAYNRDREEDFHSSFYNDSAVDRAADEYSFSYLFKDGEWLFREEKEWKPLKEVLERNGLLVKEEEKGDKEYE